MQLDHVATTALFLVPVAVSSKKTFSFMSPKASVWPVSHYSFVLRDDHVRRLPYATISPELIPLNQVTTVTKDELRAELERKEQRFKDVYGGEITTYAAQPEPERKPWRKKASLLDQAFKQELQKMEKDLKEEL
jgi:hypothetical protein